MLHNTINITYVSIDFINHPKPSPPHTQNGYPIIHLAEARIGNVNDECHPLGEWMALI